ncbi:MAG: hypothetical protein QM709_15050 [Spongiibacteraceae bacterium]
MDILARKAILTAFFLLCLIGCVSTPSDKFNFSLKAGEGKGSVWSKSLLASSSDMVFKFHLQQSIPRAADVRFAFSSFNKGDPELTIRLTDRSCSGAYEVGVSYRSGTREIQSFYFRKKLLWDEYTTIAVRWEKGNQVLMTLNGDEVKKMETLNAIRTVDINVESGGLDMDELVYQNLEAK